ncbi:MAG: response regulator transcription factor [Bacteroidales bacterium]|nr:response regulator transcription factor [Bacteroidales bacterium]
MINLLIADDHQLMIDGIRSTLEDCQDIKVAAEANDGYQVLKILDDRSDINVILMDINMPKLDGLDCTRMVSRKFPNVRIIALSQFGEKRFVKRMIKNGARGYLLKDSSKDELIQAINKVFTGEKYFSDRLSLSLVTQELKAENTKSLFPKLTEREREILNLICKEFSSQEIAEKLIVSFHTVEGHRANLLAKAGAKNTAGLVRWAVENDLID